MRERIKMDEDIYIIALSWEWFANHCNYREKLLGYDSIAEKKYTYVLCNRDNVEKLCSKENCKMVRFQFSPWEYENPGEFYERVRESMDVVPDWLKEQRGVYDKDDY